MIFHPDADVTGLHGDAYWDLFVAKGDNLGLTIPDASKLSVGGNVRISGLTPSTLNTSGIINAQISAINGNVITVVRPTGLAAPTGTATVNLTWTDPAYQVPNPGGYGANTSVRSWVNRFIRTNPNNALPFDAVADIGKWAEAGNPTTPATETGKWAALLTGGISLGSGMTSDGTHPPSWGNDYLATQLATDTALVAVLQQAA